MLHSPLANMMPATEAVDLRRWRLLLALRLPVLAAMKLHKVSWLLRTRRI